MVIGMGLSIHESSRASSDAVDSVRAHTPAQALGFE